MGEFFLKNTTNCNSKLLDITTPDITSYSLYANPYAILQCHSETREWLLSNFIQLCSNTQVLNFYDFNYKTCPLLDVQRILTEQLETMGVDWIPFIIQCLNQNRYVYLNVKRKYIDAYYAPNSSLQQSDELIHDILIYGYDIAQEIFYIADNFRNGKYSFAKCSFSALKNAIINVSPQDAIKTRFKGSIELITYTGENLPDLSVQRIYEALDDYYNCKPTGMWNIMEIRNYNRNRTWFFGLSCYEYMTKKVTDSDFTKLSIQDFHLMWEHKKHLKRIIEYLLEKEYISDSSHLEKINKIIKLALTARNLVLKAFMSEQPNIKERIIALYEQQKKIEKQLIFCLLTQLKECDMERLMFQNII